MVRAMCSMVKTKKEGQGDLVQYIALHFAWPLVFFIFYFGSWVTPKL